ncbi:MAG TPA: hypothetical protein VF610_01135 [Segetibacter sp.]|jgi:hypothetical protein
MNSKAVKPAIHGIIDYVFSAIQMGAPSAMGLNKKAVKTYQVLGAGFLTVNALTDTKVGIKPLISFKGHQKTDAGFLATLALLTFTKPILKHKKTLRFHLAFLGTAITYYVLSDYNAGYPTNHERVYR